MDPDDHGHGKSGSGGADQGGGHQHGHANDQGLAAVVRYLRHAPRMWRSEINDAVVDLVAPKPGERVVDIGAGMGAATMPAAGLGAEVIAVEPTLFIRRILMARRRLSRGRDKIKVMDGAAEHLPVADGSVDAVWAVNTMHHWVDVARGVEEIARVLRPAGRIVLVDEDFEDPRHPEHERFGDDNHDHDHSFTMVEAAGMADALRTVGLVSIEAENRLLVGRPVIAVTASAPA